MLTQFNNALDGIDCPHQRRYAQAAISALALAGFMLIDCEISASNTIILTTIAPDTIDFYEFTMRVI